MPDKRRRVPTPEELDEEARITPADVDRAKDFADRVAPPQLRAMLRAKVIENDEEKG